MTAATHTILIVDDDADFLESLSSFLEANRYRVIKASSGADGVVKARLERPDLVIMDVIMGERTEGFFAVQELRHTPGLEHVPIFVLTSLYTQEPGFKVAPDAAWMAHDEFLAKPVNLYELLEKVRRRLGSAAVREAQP